MTNSKGLLSSKPSFRGGIAPKVASLIETAAVVFLCLYTILYWLSQLQISPDSSNYITASLNFVRTGRLFVYANWPSRSLEPAIEPYTEWPPGFPLYLAPFIVVFREPVLAVAVAQSVTIALYYLVIFRLLLVLGFRPWLRVATLLLFTFLQTFRLIYGYFWTETLFIALSLGIGLCTVRIIQSVETRMYWLLTFVLLFFASSIKFLGIANLSWFIPVFLNPQFVARISKWATSRVARAALMVGGALIAILALGADFVSSRGQAGIGDMQGFGALVGLAMFVAGLEMTLFLRWDERGTEFVQDGSAPHWLWGVGALLSASLPILLWFLRNHLVYGILTRSHNLVESLLWNNLLTPFRFAYQHHLAVRWLPQPAVFVLLLALVIWPFLAGNRERIAIQLGLACALVFHFAGVWLPSLVVKFSDIADRYLAPAVAVALLAVLYGLHCLENRLQHSRARYMAVALPFLFLVFSRHVTVAPTGLQLGRINYPVEMFLWRRIEETDWADSSTHFYTDYDLRHQIFAGIPQRVVWDKSMFGDPVAIQGLLATGHRPFLLVKDAGQEKESLEDLIRQGKVRLAIVNFHDLGFTLYYSPP